MPRRGKPNHGGLPSTRPKRQKATQGNGPSEKRRRPQRTWTQKETTTILDYLKDTVTLGFEIEKPRAPIYYNHFLKKNRELENEEDHLSAEITVQMIINHVNNVKRSYKLAFDWSNATGQGLQENMGEETFKGLLLKKCRYWDLCEDIWGHRTTVRIPVVAQTTQVGQRSSTLSDSEPENNDDTFNDDYIPPSPASRPVSRERSRSPFANSPGAVLSPGSPERPPPRTQRPIEETPTQGSYSRSRPRAKKSSGHPGRKLDKGGEQLTRSFYPKGPKDTFDEMVRCREVNEGQRLKIQEEQLKLQQQQINNESRRLDDELDLKRQQFDYTKQKDAQAIELEREITRRQELRVEEMKLKLELAKLGIVTNID